MINYLIIGLFVNGAKRIRTADPLYAMQRYQSPRSTAMQGVWLFVTACFAPNHAPNLFNQIKSEKLAIRSFLANPAV